MRSLGLVLLLTLMTFGNALSREKIPPFERVAEGLEYREVLLEKPRPLSWIQLRCDPKKVRLQLLLASDESAKSSASARDMLLRHKLLAAVNSSYFGHEDEILGYAERSGEVLNQAVAPGGLFSAFFFWDGERAGLRRRGESLEDLSRTIPVLFQCGPRLVWDREPVQGLERDYRANRTCLALDREGRVVLTVLGGFSRVALAELPGLLSAPVESGGVSAVRAINLDGGKSSQLALKQGERVHYLPGRVRVPVFLGVAPR